MQWLTFWAENIHTLPLFSKCHSLFAFFIMPLVNSFSLQKLIPHMLETKLCFSLLVYSWLFSLCITHVKVFLLLCIIARGQSWKRHSLRSVACWIHEYYYYHHMEKRKLLLFREQEIQMYNYNRSLLTHLPFPAELGVQFAFFSAIFF